MEQEVIKTVEVKRKTHIFTCDVCGKCLGESTEYKMQANIGKWYKLELNVCEECENQKTKQIQKALVELGFEPEKRLGEE